MAIDVKEALGKAFFGTKTYSGDPNLPWSTEVRYATKNSTTGFSSAFSSAFPDPSGTTINANLIFYDQDTKQRKEGGGSRYDIEMILSRSATYGITSIEAGDVVIVPSDPYTGEEHEYTVRGVIFATPAMWRIGLDS